MPTGEAMNDACSVEEAARRTASLQSPLATTIRKGRGANVGARGSSMRESAGNDGECHTAWAALPCSGTPVNARMLAAALLRRHGAVGLRLQAAGAESAGR